MLSPFLLLLLVVVAKQVQRDEPDDFVLATGEMHSVREFVEKAFKHVGITIAWQNATGTVDEIGVHAANPSRVLVKVLLRSQVEHGPRMQGRWHLLAPTRVVPETNMKSLDDYC